MTDAHIYRTEVDFAHHEALQTVLKSLEAASLSIVSFRAVGPGGGNPALVVSGSDKDALVKFLFAHHDTRDLAWVESLID